MNPYRVPSPRFREPLSTLRLITFLLVCAVGAAFSVVEGCAGTNAATNTNTVITNIAPTVQCVTTDIFQKNITDPVQIGKDCAIVAISDVVALIEALLNGAGTVTDGGAPSLFNPAALTPDAVAKMHAVINKGKELISKGYNDLRPKKE